MSNATATCKSNFGAVIVASAFSWASRLGFLLALVIFGFSLFLGGCSSMKESLAKAVVMDYDDANHFMEYKFEEPIVPQYYIDPWNTWSNYSGIRAKQESGFRSFWATFVICNVRNEGSNAESFTLDLHKFYVDTDAGRFYYQALQPYTFESPNGQAGSPQLVQDVNDAFRQETQKGPDTTTFSPGSNLDLNYRFAMLVTVKGLDVPSAPLDLHYDGYPHVLTCRNQPPKIISGLPTTKADLAYYCRPPKN